MTAGRTNRYQLSLHWGTPRKYVSTIKAFFGGSIELDPCSNPYSVVGAKVEWMLPNTDGLTQAWTYESIFVNPPYGADRDRGTRIIHWLEKCWEAYDINRSEVIALVPVAVNTKHWKQYVWPEAAAICFLYDTRVRFLENGLDVGKGSPMACCLVYWGTRVDKYCADFAHHGAVVPLEGATMPNLRPLASDPELRGNLATTQRRR